MNKTIVSVKWLNNNLSDKNLIILDASPDSNVSGLSASEDEKSIPKSRHFDIKKNFSNKKSPFPNTVPSPQQFEEECRVLGINNSSKIVVYDNLGIYSSPRVWWLFNVMGHDNVSVLNGGFNEWIRQNYNTVLKSELEIDYDRGEFVSQFQQEFVITYEDVLQNIELESFEIVDARSEGRFSGVAKEPRVHLKSGSIPNSKNIPYQLLMENGKFKSKEKLREIFIDRLKDSEKLVFSCGSGLTACIVMLASELAFKKSTYLYDGSWTEYAELQNLKTETV